MFLLRERSVGDCWLKEVCVVGRVVGTKPVIKVAALAVAIVAENFLYRKMRQSGWRLRP